MTTRDDHNLIPPDLHDADRALNALADLDARGFDAAAHERVASAAANAARQSVGEQPALRLSRVESQIATHQFRRIVRPFRVAAMLLLTLTAGVVAYVAVNSSGTGTRPPGGDLTALTDDGFVDSTLSLLDFDSTGDLTTLRNDIDTVGKSVGASPFIDDDSDPSSSQGVF